MIGFLKYILVTIHSLANIDKLTDFYSTIKMLVYQCQILANEWY